MWSRGTVRSVTVGLAVVLLLAACGESSGTTPVSTDDAPFGLAATVYSVVEDHTYDGVRFFDRSVEPYNAHPEVDGWQTVGRSPVGNEHGSVILYRSYAGPSREDLGVMFTKPDNLGVHAVRLTGVTSRVHLELSCSGNALLLIPDVDLTTYRELEEAIRAWRPGPSGTLEEFDPTTEVAGSC